MTTYVVCKIFGHRRSVSCAQRVDGVWRSRCKRCGAKLVRVQRKWREAAKVDVLALRPQLLRYLDERYAIADQHGADLRSAFFRRGIERAPERDIVAANARRDAVDHR